MSSGGGHDVIVIGAGIVGAACADALSREGLRVLVLEAGVAAAGTTAAGMGHLVVMDDSPAQLALTAYAMRLWREFAPALPPRADHDPCGTLWIAENEAQLPALVEKKRIYSGADVHAEVLNAGDVQGAEPELRRDLVGGLLVPGDAVIYAPAATLALLARARNGGAVVRERCRVEAILSHGVRCDAGTIEAPIVVNAAGAAAAGLTPELPVVPRKGHLVITDRYPGFCRHQIVELGYLTSAHTMTNESVAFNVQPRATGQVLIGSSRELVGWDMTPNPGILRRMVERAIAFMPGLARLSAIRTWTGFRPATPDSLPLIGAWERVPGLWIAAGHEGLGITTALATARILADQIAGRSPAIDARPFAPARAT